jgi:hypothetical protein
MLTKAIMSAVLLIGVSSYAMAQTTTTAPSTGTPSAGSSTSSESSGKMTESQVKQKLQEQGYSDIQLKPASEMSGSSTSGSGTSTSSGSSGGEMWTGTAMKDGKTVNIDVDPSGTVTEK